jgi:hypothetical protein
MGVLQLWWRGRAFVLDGAYEGYRWMDYGGQAWYVGQRMSAYYFTYRDPLYPAVLGWAGWQLDGYADAGIAVASVSMLALVIGAALCGRALSGPWAGFACAVAAPMTATVLAAARWTSVYPFNAGMASLCLGLGAACWRWPRPVLAALCGAAGALAYASDSRGLIFVPAAALLVAGGMIRGEQVTGSHRARVLWQTHRRWLVLPVLGLLLAAGPQISGWLGEDPSRRTPTAERLESQKDVVLRWVQISNDETLKRACAGHEVLVWPPNPCNRAILDHNWRRVVPGLAPFGVLALWLGLAGSLVPGRRSWPSAKQGIEWGGPIGSVILLGGASAGAVVLSAMTPLAERYTVLLALPLTLAPAIAADRVIDLAAGRWPRVAWGLRGVVAVGIVAAAWALDPSDRDRTRQLSTNPLYPAYAQAEAMAREHVDTDVDTLLDCGDRYVAVALLPAMLTWPPPEAIGMPELTEREVQRCIDHIHTPEDRELGGAQWVIVHPGQELWLDRRVNERVDLAETIREVSGWTRVDRGGGVALYRWDGQDQEAPFTPDPALKR